MSYSSNIPIVTDFIQKSQKQMLANFQAINQSFFKNHVGLTSNEDAGKHKVLLMRPTTDPTTSSAQCALYNKLITSVPQLFYRPASNGTPIQMSNSNLNTVQTGAPPGTQVSFLAGGFTIYMGFVVNCPNLQVVTLTPSTTLIYVGLTTLFPRGQIPANIPKIPTAINLSINQFTVTYGNFSPATNPTIYYMAIGL